MIQAQKLRQSNINYKRFRIQILNRFQRERKESMDGSIFIGTAWALLPPLLAIVLALVTKEVYSSLFLGVALGALLCTGFHPWNAFVTLFEGTDGFLHISDWAYERTNKLSDVCKVGDNIKVKVTKVDEKGKVNVSRKALQPKPIKKEVKTETDENKE